MFNKELKERVKLLEYENSILIYKINEMLKQLKAIKPMFPFNHIISENVGNMNYDTLRKKYRDYTIKFKDGL